MRDGAPSSEGDAADQEALSADGRLVRRVRWQLVAWSGFSTLLVLVVLGAALYLVDGPDPRRPRQPGQLDRPGRRLPRAPGSGTARARGSASAAAVPGRSRMLTDDDGEPLGRGSFFMPDAFPIEEGIDGGPRRVDRRRRPLDRGPRRARPGPDGSRPVDGRAGVHPGDPGPDDRAGPARRDAPGAARRRGGRDLRRARRSAPCTPAGPSSRSASRWSPSASPSAASASSRPTRATSCARR